MQALEQQVGELRIDTDDGCYDGAHGDTGDSRLSSGTSTVLKLFFGHSSGMCVVKSFPNVHYVMHSLSIKPVSRLSHKIFALFQQNSCFLLAFCL